MFLQVPLNCSVISMTFVPDFQPCWLQRNGTNSTIMKNENYVINSLFVKDFIYMAFLPDIAYLLDGTLENLSCFTVQYPANPYFLVEKVKSYSRKGETIYWSSLRGKEGLTKDCSWIFISNILGMRDNQSVILDYTRNWNSKNTCTSRLWCATAIGPLIEFDLLTMKSSSYVILFPDFMGD